MQFYVRATETCNRNKGSLCCDWEIQSKWATKGHDHQVKRIKRLKIQPLRKGDFVCSMESKMQAQLIHCALTILGIPFILCIITQCRQALLRLLSSNNCVGVAPRGLVCGRALRKKRLWHFVWSWSIIFCHFDTLKIHYLLLLLIFNTLCLLSYVAARHRHNSSKWCFWDTSSQR